MRTGVLACLFALGPSLVWAAEEMTYPSFSIDDVILSASVRTADARLELRSREEKKDGEVRRVPELRVEWRGEKAGSLRAKDGTAGPFPASAGVVEMDPANDTPEFVLVSYTGGAHCCTEVSVLSKSLTGPWQAIAMGAFDGGPSLQDIDGDGRYEVVVKDPAFHYAFGCYACSLAPLKILTVQGGSMRDATFEPRFLPAHRDYLESVEEGVDMRKAGNGYLGGWVAEKIILGEGAEAWAEMLLSYDREDEWGLVACPDGGQECAEADKRKTPFPDALRALLDERGYTF